MPDQWPFEFDKKDFLLRRKNAGNGVYIMASVTIRQKIWIGFGLLVTLLIIVGVITQFSLKQNEKKLLELVNEVQPTVVTSLNLIGQLDRASASLGFYLLSKEEIHKNNYVEMLQHIDETSQRLKASSIVQRDKEMRKLVNVADKNIKELASFKEHMLELAVNDGKNVPATSFSSSNVNPKARTLLQKLQEIILAEEDQEANEERKTFLLLIANMRHILLGAINELRVYLAFRNETQILNFTSIIDSVDQKVEMLKAYDDEFLSFEQYDALEEFFETYTAWLQAANKVFEIHKAEDWRQDAYIIRKEIAPLLLQIQENLNAMVKSQYDRSIAESHALTIQAKQTQYIVTGLIGVGLISAILVGFFLSRAITRPISSLKTSAAELASGNLEQAIDVSREDELGSLAKSFADMRDSIRKKIHDLHILNSTGEGLAVLHDQIKVLEESLRVMAHQTHVEWGSVYLYNKQSHELEMKAYYPEREADHEHAAKSFQVGEGIAGKAALSQKVIYIPDTSKDPEFVVSSENDESAKAIVCVPMVDNGELYGVMNFCGEVGKVRFDKSDSEFAETIARMTVATTQNIEMLNVIEEQNRTLEHKVEARTSELKQKTNDINNMLQNMHQGIFTILPGNIIHPEYSAYLETILDNKTIANKNMMDVLFSDSDVGSNALDQVSAALYAILGEDQMMYDFNKHCLINEFKKHLSNGKEKVLELDWDPIVSDDDIIDKLMITVRDVTELRGLQAEAEKQKWELEIIGEILSVSNKKFVDFIDTSNSFINENQSVIESTDEIRPELIATLFRNMHTIKGNARTYGFDHITDTVHEAESTYAKLRKNEINVWDKKLLLNELHEAKGLIDTYQKIYQEKLMNNEENGVFMDEALYIKGKELLSLVNINDKKSLENGIESIKNVMKAIGTDTLDTVLGGIKKSMPDMASRLGKENPNLIVKDNGVRLLPEISSKLENILTHCYRNAIDHGIEPAAERIAAGKNPVGAVSLEAFQQKEWVIFKLHDDGYGLDLDRIREKALHQQLISVSDKLTDLELGNLIFHSGLSTTEVVTEISGRGVGMDAIQKFVNELAGHVELSFTGPASATNHRRSFEIRISLPNESFVKVA